MDKPKDHAFYALVAVQGKENLATVTIELSFSRSGSAAEFSVALLFNRAKSFLDFYSETE